MSGTPQPGGFRPPAWLVYPAAVALLLIAALQAREHLDAPPPPPALPAGEGAALAQAAPIDPAWVVKVRSHRDAVAATAVSVADAGVWLTSRKALAGCAHPVIMVSDTEGVAGQIGGLGASPVAILTTRSGAPALPLAAAPPRPGDLAFVAGYPNSRPGEIALRLLGAKQLYRRYRDRPPLTVLVWAEAGRTEGLTGGLEGIAGAPVLDSEGRVLGVVLGEAPGRGRLYAATPGDLAAAVAKIGASPQAAGLTITPANYGLAADELRRALRVAPVACVSR